MLGAQTKYASRAARPEGEEGGGRGYDVGDDDTVIPTKRILGETMGAEGTKVWGCEGAKRSKERGSENENESPSAAQYGAVRCESTHKGE